MNFKSLIWPAFSILLFFNNSPCVSQQLETGTKDKIYVPDKIGIQFAGNIGMFSIGPSWSFFKGKVNLDCFIGFVPKYKAQNPIFISSLKGIYSSNIKIYIKNFELRPLAIGLVTSYTYGYRFNKYNNRDNYPKGYYWWSIPLRAGFVFQPALYVPFKNCFINGLGLYFEASIWDLDLFSFLNNNHNSLHPAKILTFGVGIKFIFKATY